MKKTVDHNKNKADILQWIVDQNPQMSELKRNETETWIQGYRSASKGERK